MRFRALLLGNLISHRGKGNPPKDSHVKMYELVDDVLFQRDFKRKELHEESPSESFRLICTRVSQNSKGVLFAGFY